MTMPVYSVGAKKHWQYNLVYPFLGLVCWNEYSSPVCWNVLVCVAEATYVVWLDCHYVN